MSNRILKESICTSATIEKLSWFEEVCFYRLIVQCDDYGRMDARPSLLKARMFPLREDIESEAVSQAVAVLAEVGLVLLYETDGHPYLQLTTWEIHQRVRNKRSRFPAPYDDGQVADD